MAVSFLALAEAARRWTWFPSTSSRFIGSLLAGSKVGTSYISRFAVICSVINAIRCPGWFMRQNDQRFSDSFAIGSTKLDGLLAERPCTSSRKRIDPLRSRLGLRGQRCTAMVLKRFATHARHCKGALT